MGLAADLTARIDGRLLSRLFSAGVVFCAGTVMAFGAWLTPDPRGYATHTQLGLGNCTFLTLTGYPCPMCGMTTTFTLFMHLRPVDAILNQPFGLVLFSMMVASFAISVAELVQPRDRWTRLFNRLGPYESRLATLFLIAMGLGWTYKILLLRLWR